MLDGLLAAQGAREALQRERDLNSAILDTVGSLVVVLDSTGRVVRFNRACERATGFRSEEVCGRMPSEFLLVQEELAPLRETLKRLLQGEIVASFLSHLRTREGATRLIAWSARALAGGSGGEDYIVATGNDITEERVILDRLERTEQRYESLWTHNQDGVFMVDLEGRFTEANPACERISGYTIDELRQRTFMEICAPDCLEKTMQSFAQGMSGSPQDLETALTRKDGRRVELYISGGPMVINGRVVGTFGVAKDVTERRRSQDALRMSEALFKTFMDHTPAAAFIRDRDGRVVFINRTIERALGVRADQVIGRPLPEVIAPELLRQWTKDDADVLAGKVVSNPEVLASPDGPQTWLSVRFPVLDRDGRMAIGGVSMNLTERVRAEEALRRANEALESRVAERTAELRQANERLRYELVERERAEHSLRESERRYRLLAENSTDMICRYRPDASFLYASPASASLLGYAPEELTGRSFFELIHPEDTAAAEASYQKILCGNGAQRVVLRTRHKEGRYLHVEYTGRSTRDPQTSRVLEIQTTARDVSQSVLAGQRTERLLEQVITAQEEERARLARELHDETGQSLTSLLVGLRSLEDMASLPAAQERARELRHMASLTLENIRRLSAGLRPSLLDDLGLFAALNRCVSDYMQAHPIRVELEADAEDLADLSPAAATAVYRIVQEALTNIARHSGAKAARIVVDREPGTLEVVIEDDGCGFRAEPLLSGAEGVRHMGIQGMRERASLLGGTLHIESSPGRGTTVIVRILLGHGTRAHHG